MFLHFSRNFVNRTSKLHSCPILIVLLLVKNTDKNSFITVCFKSELLMISGLYFNLKELLPLNCSNGKSIEINNWILIKKKQQQFSIHAYIVLLIPMCPCSHNKLYANWQEGWPEGCICRTECSNSGPPGFTLFGHAALKIPWDHIGCDMVQTNSYPTCESGTIDLLMHQSMLCPRMRGERGGGG